MSTRTQDGKPPASSISFRHPRIGDGAPMLELVKASPPLEPNTCYAYLLLCHHFGDTCIVAEHEGDLWGFVVGYRPPKEPDTLFVWQIAVSSKARGQGLGSRLLRQLLESQPAGSVRYLTSTVTPGNEPSMRLFHSFAEKLGVPCEQSVLFEESAFGQGEHEEEHLLRIGPINSEARTTDQSKTGSA